ncbi:MAG: Fic/DOC family protein [Ruminococcus sp.]
MSKYDIYLQDNSNVLKNRLGITDETALDKAESMMVRTRMALLYNSSFSDFSAIGICKLHKILFGDVYDWAGKYREINIQKRERILVGKSVWYSNWDTIDRDLNKIWNMINAVDWQSLNQETFAKKVAQLFSAIWQVHPFREGNTRTTVMLIALFVEHYGYYFDYELISSSAGYVRNAFVLSCLGEYSEFEHLEKILIDAISNEPIEDIDIGDSKSKTKETKYKKYYTADYKPTPHEYVEG